MKDCEEILSEICEQIDEPTLFFTPPLADQFENQENETATRRRKRTSTSANSITRKKKLRANSTDNQTNLVDENANDIHTNSTIDYLALEPERIVSITRSHTANQLDFLLKCKASPTKLYFISNDKAKELVPDLLIEFYEKHINWFIDRPPSSKPNTVKRKS